MSDALNNPRPHCRWLYEGINEGKCLPQTKSMKKPIGFPAQLDKNLVLMNLAQRATM